MRILQISIGVAIALSWTDARAERTAILVSGTAPQHERELSRSAMSASVRAEGSEVIAASFTQAETGSLQKCLTEKTPWTCLKGLADSKGIDQLVLGSVDAGTSSTGAAAIQITAYLVVSTLDYAMADRRHCDPCTDDVLTNLAGELLQVQLRRLAVLRGKTLISVHPTPRNARITLDGETRIAPDTVLATYPGPHVIQLELDGHHGETRTIEAVEGKTVAVTVTLRPIVAPRADPVRPPPRPSRRLPILVGALGATAAVAGAVLIAVHDPPEPGPGDAPEFYYATRTPGIITAIGGALALGTGVYLWRSQARSAVVASPAPRGGVAIRWTASF